MCKEVIPLLFFVSSVFIGCSVESHSVLYNNYGDVANNQNHRFLFVDTLTNFSIALPMKGEFLAAPSKRQARRAGYPKRFLLGTKGLTPLFANHTKLMHTNFRSAYVGDIPPEKLAKNIRKAYRKDPNTKNSPIDKKLLPSQLREKLYQGFIHKIKDKAATPVTLVDLIWKHNNQTFLTRFWYRPDDLAFKYDDAQILQSSIQPELHSIRFDYYEELEKTLLQSPLMGAMQVYQESQKNYLIPVYWLNRIKDSLDSNDQNKSFEFKHATALFRSYITPLRGDTIKDNYPFFNFNDSADYLAKKTIPSDAIKEISEQLDQTDLVLLNENHVDPYCRYFASQLLDSFMAKGYRHLFIEGLNYEDITLNRRGYPTKETGFYLSDPTFGNLVRKALHLGFQLIPYEGKEGSKNREQGQAQHIAESLSKSGIKKALIYAGHSHIYKSSAKKYMASYLRDYTQLRLISIEQSFNAYLPQDIKKKLTSNSGGPIMLLNKETSKDRYWRPRDLDRDVDMVVIHPEESLIDNYIPSWKLDIGKKTHRIVLHGNKFKGQLLELTKKEETSRNRVPLFNLILKEQNDFEIHLPPGSYELTVYNLYREVLEKEHLIL